MITPTASEVTRHEGQTCRWAEAVAYTQPGQSASRLTIQPSPCYARSHAPDLVLLCVRTDHALCFVNNVLFSPSLCGHERVMHSQRDHGAKVPFAASTRRLLDLLHLYVPCHRNIEDGRQRFQGAGAQQGTYCRRSRYEDPIVIASHALQVHAHTDTPKILSRTRSHGTSARRARRLLHVPAESLDLALVVILDTADHVHLRVADEVDRDASQPEPVCSHADRWHARQHHACNDCAA